MPAGRAGKSMDAGFRRVFVSVAEDSADVHAAAMVQCAQELLPDCRFYGLTGPRMRAAGVETIYDFAAHAAMLTGVLGLIGRAREAIRAVMESWRQSPPAAIVLLDSPELNLRLAKRAKRMGLPVLYYIAPQTWAAREYRNRQIRRDVDRLACILPFEEEYFRRAGVRAEFVGHPLLEVLAQRPPEEEAVQRLRAGGGPLLALLPGSRRHVVDALLPRQLEVVRGLGQRGLHVRAAISCVSEERAAQVRQHVSQSGLPAELVVDDNASLLRAADLALVASGTATLEVAYYGTPMVVMYDVGGLLAWPYRLFGRVFLNTPHLALLNVLAGARVVPEFMPLVPDTRPVALVAEQLLKDEAWRRLLTRQLADVVRPLVPSQASARVCEILVELLDGQRGGRGTQCLGKPSDS